MALLGICRYSIEYALAAQQNGVDRVELYAVPKEGGLTPSLGVLKSVRQWVTIPVHPIIRPRGGDFCYSDGESAATLEDVRTIHELGFLGLVAGVPDVDGNADMPRMEKITVAVGPLAVTSHRVFNMCANPLYTLNNLAESGITRVLTSGQKSDALQGSSKTMELIAHRDAPIIIAGAGARAKNLHHFLDAGVLKVHSSAGVRQASPMRYRNQGLSISPDEHADEYSRYIVDGAAVVEMGGIIECYQAKRFLPLHHVAQYDACPHQAPAVPTEAFFYPRTV